MKLPDGMTIYRGGKKQLKGEIKDSDFGELPQAVKDKINAKLGVEPTPKPKKVKDGGGTA